jgi:hypothetical protein
MATRRNLYTPLSPDGDHGSERKGGGSKPVSQGEKHGSKRAGEAGQPGQNRLPVKNSPGRANEDTSRD